MTPELRPLLASPESPWTAERRSIVGYFAAALVLAGVGEVFLLASLVTYFVSGSGFGPLVVAGLSFMTACVFLTCVCRVAGILEPDRDPFSYCP